MTPDEAFRPAVSVTLKTMPEQGTGHWSDAERLVFEMGFQKVESRRI